MRQVIRSDQAESDYAGIIDYLLDHSVAAAFRFEADLAKRLKLAASQPHLGRDRGALRLGLRSCVVGRYVIFYTYNEAEV